MKWIDYAHPQTVREAVNLMADAGEGGARALAGGTDLLVHLRANVFTPDVVVDVKGVPELNEVSYNPSTGLVYSPSQIGAGYNYAADLGVELFPTDIGPTGRGRMNMGM